MGIVTVTTFTSDIETVTRTKLNGLAGNLVTEFNGSISNANIAADAGIVATKLVLTSLSSNIAFTGTLDFSGATITAGFTVADITATTADINGGTIDGVTLGGASACTVTAFDTVADLGIVTTADINGGTLDGVNIGTTTATGELIVNNASDAADGLGDQGTSGEVLTSAGSGANPTWESSVGSEEFTSGGTFSVPTGISIVYVTMVGGGGGAGGGYEGSPLVGSSGGGGGEGFIHRPVAVTPLEDITVTIGGGGVGGSVGHPGGNGTAGTNSSFGALLVALAGAGGRHAHSQTATGGAGGYADPDGGDGATGGGYVSFSGGKGGDGDAYPDVIGGGGGSLFGIGGNSLGADGSGYGSGGAGGQNSTAGGDGTDGYCLIEW